MVEVRTGERSDEGGGETDGGEGGYYVDHTLLVHVSVKVAADRKVAWEVVYD